jgi:hypothetical protein
MIGLMMMLAAVDAAVPEFMTGNDLSRMCQATELERSFCIGYVAGVSDDISEVTRATGVKIVCSPSDISAGQSMEVVVRYLKGHPAALDAPAPKLIGIALAEAFPCPKGR